MFPLNMKLLAFVTFDPRNQQWIIKLIRLRFWEVKKCLFPTQSTFN